MNISVIIPTYRPGDYIWECLDSLRKQTLDKSEFEIVLVLNGCCEPYNSLIKNYIDENLTGYNVKYIQTDTPGVSNARNVALDQAVGEYITFIDDDDYVSEEYLSELYAHATPETIALSYPYEFMDGTRGQVASQLNRVYEKLSVSGRQPYEKSRKYFSGPCMKLIHKDIIGVRRYDKRLSNCEDTLFMFLISDLFKYVDYTSSSAVYYRRHREGSAIYSENGKWKIIMHRLKFCSYCTAVYFIRPSAYKFSFYMTRLLSACKTIIRTLI